MDAVADHGEITGDTVHGTYEESRAVIDRIEELGISYDEVVEMLEDEGVSKFDALLGRARRHRRRTSWTRRPGDRLEHRREHRRRLLPVGLRLPRRAGVCLGGARAGR
ncbi:MAG: hypothetical protein WKF83_04525 [Nocardioidaceae bacterium]